MFIMFSKLRKPVFHVFNCYFAARKFSVELDRTIRSRECFGKIPEFLQYEQQLRTYFQRNPHKTSLREGHLKQSFIYMLIDPRISNNLPGDGMFMNKFDVWKKFLAAVFYVGKGKAARPYSHLYDAMKRLPNLRVKNAMSGDVRDLALKKSRENKKLEKILDIWAEGKGVVCLHVFHNILPIEAYTREAAIIDAFSLKYLTNVKRGDYYGLAHSWTMTEKRYMGIALLFRAMHIYLAEGESQLSPSDLI